MISFNIWSGITSSFEKSSLFDSALNLFFTSFFSFKSTLFGLTLKARKSALLLKLRHIGVAAASYWVKGGGVIKLLLLRDQL
ncbi:hypothetical protein [Mucilaginibacter lappiensis]|uniref:hypothetical protein n=1 Tax=Mucilaginibacter lappiensis TaxID=354630 RepID=UPI003D1AA608